MCDREGGAWLVVGGRVEGVSGLWMREPPWPWQMSFQGRRRADGNEDKSALMAG